MFRTGQPACYLEAIEEELHATVLEKALAVQRSFVRHVPHGRPRHLHYVIANVSAQLLLDELKHCLRKCGLLYKNAKRKAL